MLFRRYGVAPHHQQRGIIGMIIGRSERVQRECALHQGLCLVQLAEMAKTKAYLVEAIGVVPQLLQRLAETMFGTQPVALA